MGELARSFQFDDSDPIVFERFFKHALRGGEERLMLAVLQDAIECFQANALSEQPWEKKLFQEAEYSRDESQSPSASARLLSTCHWAATPSPGAETSL